MAIQVLVPAAIALALAGTFTAAWLRFSKPVRAMDGKERVAPRA